MPHPRQIPLGSASAPQPPSAADLAASPFPSPGRAVGGRARAGARGPPCTDCCANAARPGAARPGRASRDRQARTPDGPDQVRSWDFTKLKGPVRGVHYLLYVIIDIFSRKVVHWEIWPAENGTLVKEFIQHAITADGGVAPRSIHADRRTVLLPEARFRRLLPFHFRGPAIRSAGAGPRCRCCRPRTPRPGSGPPA
ncbi:DDE-type integrase/transposase/recombinase [Actinomadura algeriensis]|uniref:DDE-type integrase/transposase/recombinase n=1 Tax=Actinomadura algeriensis TaxID=1679523 RepID=UPI00384B5CE2